VSDDRIDQLRQELRARGYLDAGVDRFVLGGAARRARPTGVALAASARIGLLAGLLLGPAAAIGLRLRMPELVTGVADAAVLSLYLGVLFWIAAGGLAAATVLAAAGIARRRATGPEGPGRMRRAAAGAGLLVGLACLVYLTLWWRTAAGLAGSASVAASLGVMAVAVAISLLLGHAVAMTVLACLIRLGLAPAAGRLPMSSPKTLVPLGAAALGGALGLLLITAPGATGEEPPPLTVVPTGLRVALIAVDGVDPATVDRLRNAGRLPTWDRLLSQGVGDLAADEDRDPARVWTSIATGQPPERHGVRALESRQVAGLEGRLRANSRGWALLAGATDVLRLTRPAIASGDERHVPAFWEVAARAGLRTAVVHWWATWPVEQRSGVVLSDRAILRLEHGGPLDAEIAPPSLYDTLKATWLDRRARAQSRATRLATSDLAADVGAVLRRSAELDATIADLAAYPSSASADLLVAYFPGLDIGQSTLLAAGARPLATSSAAERVAALERYYEYLDGLIADLLAGLSRANRLDVLVTQPGRVRAPAGGRLGLSGSAARPARVTAGSTAVAATVLYALGVPAAADLASPPAVDLFAAAFVGRYPVRGVKTYGPRRSLPGARSGRTLDREMIERMRSLGYVR